MPSDPNLNRQIQNLADMKRAAERNVDSLKQQIKLLDRQIDDSKRVDGGRQTSRLRDESRSKQREIDKLKDSIRVFDRQMSDLKRMQR